jgi:steroid delta-isomerase
MSRETVEQTLNAYYAALNTLEPDAFVNTFAPDAVSNDPVGAPPNNGHAGVRQFINGLAAAFSKVDMSQDFTSIAGDRAAVKWTVNGVLADGRSVTFEGIDVFELNAESKIQNLWGYWDPSVIMG